MKDLGESQQYLGLEIEYIRHNHSMKLSQSGYVKNLAEKYDVTGSKLHDIPLEINLKLEPVECMSQVLLYEKFDRRIFYTSRQELAFAVNYLSRFQNSYS